jgi:hypothetical protein
MAPFVAARHKDQSTAFAWALRAASCDSIGGGWRLCQRWHRSQFIPFHDDGGVGVAAVVAWSVDFFNGGGSVGGRSLSFRPFEFDVLLFQLPFLTKQVPPCLQFIVHFHFGLVLFRQSRQIPVSLGHEQPVLIVAGTTPAASPPYVNRVVREAG